jgi:hypothetical protein
VDESEVCLHCGEATTTVDEGKVVVGGDSPDDPTADERRVFCSLEHAHDWQLAKPAD